MAAPQAVCHLPFGHVERSAVLTQLLCSCTDKDKIQCLSSRNDSSSHSFTSSFLHPGLHKLPDLGLRDKRTQNFEERGCGRKRRWSRQQGCRRRLVRSCLSGCLRPRTSCWDAFKAISVGSHSATALGSRMLSRRQAWSWCREGLPSDLRTFRFPRGVKVVHGSRRVYGTSLNH